MSFDYNYADNFADDLDASMHPVARRHVCHFGGGKSSGGGNTTTTQAQSTQAPPSWYGNAQTDLYKNSMNVADQLGPQQYAQVAPLTGGQNSLIQSLMGNVGSQNGTYAGAQNTLGGLQNFAAPNVSAGQLANTNLQPYMDPFTAQVVSSTNAIGQQALGQALSQTGATAAGAGAFGGSRQGIQEGVAGSQYALGAAQTNAQLQQANYQQAQAAAMGDINNRLGADTTNAGNALNSAGLRMNAANSAISGAGQQSATYLNQLMAALQGQGLIQGQAQAVNQYQADTANAQNNLGTQRLGIQSGTLNGFQNVGGTSQTNQTQQKQETGGSGILQGLGGGLGLLSSLASPLGGSAGAFGAASGSFGSSLLGAGIGLLPFSDRRAKDDHGTVGRAHGVDVHQFNYKGDGDTYQGPMAQDLERSRYSDAVRTDPRTGLKVVDQAAVPAGLRMRPSNGLSVDATNPHFKRKTRRKGRR